jgi:voltage-gated potassium channel
MTLPPTSKPARIDRHWARQLVFTLALSGLVAAATGVSWPPALAGLALSAVSLGFFYLLFPGGLHFGVTTANFLAVYACLFAFFREANFPEAQLAPTILALIIPVAAFLLRCFVARRRVAAMIRARRLQELTHLPRLTRWVPGVATVGAITFALPQYGLPAEVQSLLLVVSMTLIGGFIAAAQRDVILLMMDVAMVFETMATRIDRMVMPVMAFLTVYGLLIVVFACLYRIAELTAGAHFSVHGHPDTISFADALYFSVMTVSTVGYGDIAPDGPLVRALAALEVMCGLLMLLFGFAEIMRGSGPESEHRRRLRSTHEQKSE